MPRCSAINCSNIGIHRFPADRKGLQLWIKAICRKNWRPSSTARLCREHFKPSDYYEESKYTGVILERKNLKKGAVPTMFSYTKSEDQAKSSRALRYKASQKKEILNSRQETECLPDVALDLEIEDRTEDVKDVSNVAEQRHKSTQINTEHT